MASGSESRSDQDLRGAVIVTGASRGIGRALASEFAGRGHAVCLVARHGDALQRTAQELQRDFQVPVRTYPVDVSADGAAENLREAMERDGVSVKYLVNNAACWSSGEIEITGVDEMERVISTNVLAPVRLTKMFLPHMAATGGGVLWLSSLAALMPAPTLATYGASKAFLRAFSVAMHEECRARGVSSCVALPGFVATDFVTTDGPLWHHFWKTTPETVAKAAYRGLVTGQATVVPGLLNRLMYFGIRTFPDPLIEPLFSVASRRYH